MRMIRIRVAAVVVALGASIVAGAQSAPKGLAPALSLNHFEVTVSDLKRSQEFYAKLLGATIIDTSENVWTSAIPGTGVWLSLTKAHGTDPTTGLDSKPGTFTLGIGIDLTAQNAEQVRTAIRQAFPNAKVASPGKPGDAAYDMAIYVDHPDGIRIRLVSSKDDGRLLQRDKAAAFPRTPAKGVVTMRNLNHVNVRGLDMTRSQEFYTALLGAPVREQAANGRTVTLSVAGGPFWLRITATKDPALGVMDHSGLGIDITPDTAEGIRNALKEAFPGLKVYSPGKPEMSIYNRSVYIVDPDGLLYQLISSTDNGATGV